MICAYFDPCKCIVFRLVRISHLHRNHTNIDLKKPLNVESIPSEDEEPMDIEEDAPDDGNDVIYDEIEDCADTDPD